MKLLDQLKKIESENLTSFHVPGHKYTSLYEKYYKGFEKILNLDVTEFPGTDDLHFSETCIKNSQDFASQLYNTKESFFLVNGTTCGIYAMIMSVTKPGDKILVARDCHRAVYDAAFLGHLQVISIEPKKDLGLILGLDYKSVKAAIDEHPDAKALVLTYPNYHGITCDLERIIPLVHSSHMFMLVDEAHGAHLKFSDELPRSAVDLGADIVVQSSHKSLPVLTQASMLHLNSERVDRLKLKHMLKVHQTSSPSYLLMVSIDIGLRIMTQHNRMDDLLKDIRHLKEKLPYFLNKCDLPEGFDMDESKLTLLGSRSYDPMDIEEKLRKNGIQCEFSNENHAVFVTSMMNDSKDFDKLFKTMEMLKFKCYSGIDKMENYLKNQVVMTITDAFYRSRNTVSLEEAIGCISAEYIIPYPPGIPLLIPGERIDEFMIEKVNKMLDNGQKIVGMRHQRMIDVVSNKEAK